jgi:hypothetical protein
MTEAGSGDIRVDRPPKTPRHPRASGLASLSPAFSTRRLACPARRVSVVTRRLAQHQTAYEPAQAPAETLATVLGLLSGAGPRRGDLGAKKEDVSPRGKRRRERP